MLTSNRKRYLRHYAFDLDVNDPSDKLIASANSPELGTPGRYGDFSPRYMQISVYLSLGNSMVPTLGLNSPHLPREYPTLES